MMKSILGKTGILRYLSLIRDAGDRRPSARTRGIERHEHNGVVFLDLGGQAEYLVPHQSFLPPSTVPVLNILAESVIKPIQNTRASLRMWGDYAACQQKMPGEKINVLIVGTRADKASKSQMNAFHSEQQFLKKSLGSHVHFFGPEVVLADVRDAKNPGVALIKDVISSFQALNFNVSVYEYILF